MSLSDHNNDMSISSGVMAAVAVVYAGYLAGNWNRRQGKVHRRVNFHEFFYFFAKLVDVGNIMVKGVQWEIFPYM